MSEVKVNKISPRSGTTLTIGDNGDTTNVVGTLQNNGAALVGDISSVVAGTNLSGGGTSGDVTINLADASTSAKGAASFSSDNFAASSGAVTIKDLGIATAELQDDSVTYAKMQDTGTANRVLGAASAGTIGEVQIATDMVADNAVTLAKMASGTDGNIISYDASGNPVAIATGSDGQVLTSAGAGAQPAFETLPVGGITMADQWRLSAAITGLSGASDKISSNWERTDTTGYGTIGSAMSQSSGTFTFPATGIYLIMYKINGKSTTGSNNRYANGNLYTTTNNSSYAIAARGAGSGSGNLWDFETTAIFIFDVTNTSTHKVQMGYEFEASTSIYGGTNDSQTCVTFIRLGDT